MSLLDLLKPLREENFIALILDNEVTVGEFVTVPPLPWRRIVFANGAFRVADGYPTLLTEKQAEFEMTNWDQVDLDVIRTDLKDIGGGADGIVFGNNAGQGVPLAASATPMVAANQGVIIFARNLPEQAAYERLGYQRFCGRRELVPELQRAALASGRTLSLCFINTIQHNQTNFYRP